MKKNLLSSIVAVALLTGCGEDKKASDNKPVIIETKVQEVKVKEVITPEAKLVEQVKTSTEKVASQIIKESKAIMAVGSDAVKSVTNKVVAKAKEVKNEVVEKVIQAKETIEKSINNIVATKAEIQKETAMSSVNTQGLYLKCAGCHGQTAEKEALGKSQVIQDWDPSKIVTALKGYKADTYGGAMKGVMKSQVMNLNDDEINALGEYISSF